MAVKTAQVTGRRQLHFESYDDVVNDVRKLASGPWQALGNWSLGDVCQHLAKTMDMSIDGPQAQVPWILRKIGPLLKKRFISRPMPAGYTVPNRSGLLPDAGETAAGVAALERAVARLRQTGQRRPHMIFGPMSQEEWDRLHMRHSELHLSFIVPE